MKNYTSFYSTPPGTDNNEWIRPCLSEESKMDLRTHYYTLKCNKIWEFYNPQILKSNITGVKICVNCKRRTWKFIAVMVWTFELSCKTKAVLTAIKCVNPFKISLKWNWIVCWKPTIFIGPSVENKWVDSSFIEHHVLKITDKLKFMLSKD